jgi:citronellol/citronellal dehydrogenase
MKEKWFAAYTGYAMAKFGMSLVVLGLAGELRGKVGVNALWPRTTIATSAIKNIVGGDAADGHVAHAADSWPTPPSRSSTKPKTFTGNFLLDDTFLAGEGVTDFDQYRADPTQRLQIDFFVPDEMPPPKGVSLDKMGS